MKKVALKQILAEYMADMYYKGLLESELLIMQNLKKIKSKNIVKLNKILKSENEFYFILEYCPDGNLNEYVIKNG
jgi:serine/threonine protein kinase